MIKSHRTVDPKLRIRPFRAKVTFSEDTKSGEPAPELCREIGKGGATTSTKWDSSSDSISSTYRGNEETISLKRHSSDASERVPIHALLKVSDIPFSDTSKRRQSLDPVLYSKTTKTLDDVQLTKDNWLHYQSLPNIQEEDPTPIPSPTEMSPAEKMLQSIRQSPPTNNDRLSPTPSLKEPSEWTGDEPRRRSIKRQKSQELTDDDLKKKQPPPLAVTLPPPVPPLRPPPQCLKKQSSDESQTSNLTDCSSTSNTNKAPFVPASILRRRKEDLKPQASTESDTGSYHTVSSLKMQKSNSSSVDSFTSALSESLALSVASNGSDKPVPPNGKYPRKLQAQPSVDENNGYSYTPRPSKLVPKIIFSQSTPSVTSQSSDDLSSPKWDDRFPSTFTQTDPHDEQISQTLEVPPPSPPHDAVNVSCHLDMPVGADTSETDRPATSKPQISHSQSDSIIDITKTNETK